MTAARVAPVVQSTDDAAVALESTGAYLRSRPVENSLVLSLLAERVARPAEGRYWWVLDGDEVVAFAFQSPRRFRAVVRAEGPAAIDPLVDRMVEDAPALPGVMAEAATAAAFAGRWAERRRTPAVPIEGQRLHRLGALRPPDGVPGALRPARREDRRFLVTWAEGFMGETGSHPVSAAEVVNRHLDAGRLWLWEDGGPASIAATSVVVAGVVRVGCVYTPPERRRRRYAGACVAAVSAQALAAAEVDVCILYTQLQNPTSNALYRRLGYEPVAELLVYQFG